MALLDGFRSRRNSAKAGGKPSPSRPAPRRLGIMALEPRIMYDAAAAATVGAAAQTHADAATDHAGIAAAEKSVAVAASNTGAPAAGADAKSLATSPNVQTATEPARSDSSLDASSTGAPAAGGTPREVVFIDPQSADLMNLYSGVKSGDLVFVLDPTRDGVQQIADILAAQNLHDLDAIHIVSHGTQAEVQLGTTMLSENNINDHAAALAAIGAALNQNGDILLYGCDVAAGSDGQQFIADLARLTGADVAASTDTTGSADLGGNWTLESVTGTITATMPFTDAALASYEGTLAISFSAGSTSTFPSASFAGRVVVGDFNGDGAVDMLYQTGGNGSAFAYALNNGNGTFTLQTLAQSPFAGLSLPDDTGTNYFVADLNGDGRLDVYATVNATTGSYFRNDGTSFSSQSTATFPAPSFGARVAVGDFDSDGDADILYQTGANGSAFAYALNNGNGTFTLETLAQSPFAGLSLPDNTGTNYFVADFNADGRLDVYVGVNATTGSYFRNDGTSFSSQSTATFPAPSFGARVAVGDFDSDGDADILYQTGGNGSAFAYALNNGNGTFTLETLAQSPFAGLSLPDNTGTNYSVADFDGDGDVDVYASVNATTGSYFVQGSNSGGDGHPPHLTSSTPADNATDVALNANITLNFSESVSKGTGNIYIVRTSDNTVVETIAVGSAQVTGSGASWTIDPSITLAGGTNYAVRIDAKTFADSDGAVFFGINDNTRLNFQTHVNTPPTITSNGSGASASVNIAENSTAVTTVTATDPDVGDTLTYSISGGADAAKFAINALTGALTFVAAPNFEVPTDAGGNNVYDVTVQVSDGTATDTQALAVTVTNVNEAPTVTSNGGGAAAAVSVAENSTAVTTVTAGDPDAGTTLTYSLNGGADAAKFSIDATTGALTFIAAPDFETPTDVGANNVYDVVVQVSDGTLTDSQAVAVTVTNVNDNPPAITSNGGGPTAATNVAENTTAVTTVTASDADAGATFTYSISGGADAAKFAIDATTGALTFVAAPDFETPTDVGGDNIYDVTVQVSDGTFTDTQAIAVTVTNANEAPAITSNGGGAAAAVNVAENSTAVTTVTAIDPDAGSTLVYSIVGGADAGKFSIDTTTGALTFITAPDFETPTDVGANNVYDVTVQVSDGALIDTQAIAVTVTNVNEAPAITSNGAGPTASVNVAENSTAVTTVTAADPDAGTTLVYSISGGADAAKFAIDAATGALVFVSAPDFENPTDAGADNTYDVTVQVSDGALTDTQAIAVTVNNANEAPAITSNGGGAAAAVNVAENSTAVTTLTAVDPDAGTTLVYSITGGVDAARFSIDTATGALTFVSAPDFETPTDSGGNNVYDVVVQVSDGSLIDSQAIAVTVTDVNDNAPVITSNGSGASASVNVAENATAVTTVTATDADAGTTFTYSIAGGADAAKFAIDATTGALTFVSAPDFETPTDVGGDNVYDVTVQVSDGTHTDSQAIAVTVTNVNEAPAITSNGGGAAAAVNVAENSTAVTAVTAVDPDAGSTLVYSITGGVDAAKFSIDTATGALVFVSAPDFENPTDSGGNNVYDVVVQVSDGTFTDGQAIAVTVTDVNDNAPVITSNGSGASASVNVAENATAVTTVTASDADAGTTFTYSIAGGADAAKFAIDATTGALTFITAPDFETPTDAGADNVYDVTVQVSDGANTDSQAIAVTVTNVNEAPVIGSNGGGASAAVNVAENSTAVTTVAATDSDAGTTLTYSISGGADAAKFAINAATGVLTFITAPDFESPTDVGADNVYDVTVQASDGALIDTQAIAVTVTNVNEAPAITSDGAGPSASVNVAENSTAVTTVTASDPDAGTTLVYSISGGADAAKFAIDATTGALTFISAPDFETPADAGADNIYDVTVQVSDGALIDSQAIAVTVTNVNEAPAITSNGGGTTASVNVAENSTAVTMVAAADPDAGTTLTYSISGGADAAKFAINAATGALTFVSAPDFETPTDAGADNIYDVTVQVSDGTLIDSQAIAVTVTNVNEVPTISSDGGGASASLNVAENSTAVTTVTAIDPDAGTTLTYSISGGADAAKFAINASTGALIFVTAPDFETPTDAGADNVYDVVVQVSDGSLTDSQAIAVTVTNVNEAPVIGSNGGGAAAALNVSENGTAVTAVAATDPDAGTTLSYSISGGADAAKFAINASTGALTFVSAPDFEAPTDAGTDNVYDVVVQVSDGALTDSQAIAVTVTNVNEAPSGASHTVVTTEDTAYVFAVSDFGFADASDVPANGLQAVIISGLPGAGTLTDNGVAVVAGQAVSATDIAAGRLVFTPAQDGNGAAYASFTFQVQDNGGTANGGVDTDPSARTLTIDVTPVNDAPVVISGHTQPFNANDGTPAPIDPAIVVSDVDSPTLSGASVLISSGLRPADDSLVFANQNGISGSYNSATGVLTLSGVASVADYQAALRSVSFTSTAQVDGARTVQWTVNDGSVQFSQSAVATSTVNVSGIITPPHLFSTLPPVETRPSVIPAGLSFDTTPSGPLPPVGDDFTPGRGHGYSYVRTDPALTYTADAGVQINLALAGLGVSLGGDVAYVTARQINGDPLPDWLKFDPATGTFAGLPPDGAVADLAPGGVDVVTGALPPNGGLGTGNGNGAPPAKTITVEVVATDYDGNVAVTVFTIELRPRPGKQGWNMEWRVPSLGERHAGLPAMSAELAAIEAALRDVTHVIEPFRLVGLPSHFADAAPAGRDTASAGRAGLTEQLASVGWKSMAAQRNALLASLQQGR
jgi:methionine-rich copper-binding protein CopC